MKAPSSSAATNQLLQQYALSQAQSQQQQDAFKAQLAQQQTADQALVAGQQSTLNGQVASATKRPVDFKTILTSPSGLLGNPLLSQSKLG